MPRHLPREPIGTTIGEFTLLNYVETGDRPKGQSPYAMVKCSCGVEKVASWKAIRSGRIKTCGHSKGRGGKYKVSDENGKTKVIYNRWGNLKQRFNNKKSKQYQQFEENDIKLEWKDYPSFYDDMNESFGQLSKNHEQKDIVLYRNDETKNFNKDNCYWGTKKVVYPIVIDGKEYDAIEEISKEYDIPESTIINRMYVFGYKGRQIVD